MISKQQAEALQHLVNRYSEFGIPGVTFQVNTYRGQRHIGFHMMVNGELRYTLMINRIGFWNCWFCKFTNSPFTNAELGTALFGRKYA